MKNMKLLALAAVGVFAVGATQSMAAPIAPGAPLLNQPGISAENQSNIHEVRWRGRGHYRPHHGYGYHRRGYGWGPAIGGLAAGAIIGGAIANSNARAADRTDAYCSQRFRSYDPGSGTYLGYDGQRHPCP